jgi:hypothetical protein
MWFFYAYDQYIQILDLLDYYFNALPQNTA